MFRQKVIISCFKKKIFRSSVKVRGDALMMSLLFSVFVILVAVGLSKFLAQDLFFVRTILFSEKAYFAAESGLEVTLLELQENPIKNIENENVSVGENYWAEVTAKNLVPLLETDIAPNQTKRFRLQRDLPGDPVLQDWSVEVRESGPILWRIVCRKNDQNEQPLGTVSISGSLSGGQNIASFANEIGSIEDLERDSNGTLKDMPVVQGSVGNFLTSTISQELEKKTCYFNVQNISENVTTLVLQNSRGIVPEAVIIRATGNAGIRQKTLHYVFGQKTLTSFFDFGFLLSE